MSDRAHPVETAFDAQRAAVRTMSDAAREAVAFRGRLGRATLDSLDAQRSLQRSALATGESAIELGLTMLQQSIPSREDAPGDEFADVWAANEASVDVATRLAHEGFDAADRLNDASWTAAARWLELAERSAETVDEAMLAMLDASVETTLESTETVGRATARATETTEETVNEWYAGEE